MKFFTASLLLLSLIVIPSVGISADWKMFSITEKDNWFYDSESVKNLDNSVLQLHVKGIERDLIVKTFNITEYQMVIKSEISKLVKTNTVPAFYKINKMSVEKIKESLPQVLTSEVVANKDWVGSHFSSILEFNCTDKSAKILPETSEVKETESSESDEGETISIDENSYLYSLFIFLCQDVQ